MAFSKIDFVPMAFVVQLLISVFVSFGSVGKHEVDGDGAQIFRINPTIAWMVTVSAFGIATILGAGIAVSKPSPVDAPLSIMMSQVLFFFFGLYGLSCIVMRIRIDAESIRVKTIFRTRATHFRNVRSASDKLTGRFRTFDVFNDQGKRMLHVTSAFFPDYDDLVQLVEERVRTYGVHQRSDKK